MKPSLLNDLNQAVVDKADQFKAKVEPIGRWLRNAGVDDWTVNVDFTVNVFHDVDLANKNITTIPFKFDTVRGHFDISHNPDFSRLEFLPTEIGGGLDISFCGFRSLANIHTVVKQCQYITAEGNELNSRILGVMLIKGIRKIQLVEEIHWNQQLATAQEIINRNLEKGDIHLCQDQLIEAGLGQFAKL